MSRINTINFVINIMAILCIFFGGYLIGTQTDFPLSVFLFVAGVLLSQIRAVPEEKETEE